MKDEKGKKKSKHTSFSLKDLEKELPSSIFPSTTSDGDSWEGGRVGVPMDGVVDSSSGEFGFLKMKRAA